MGFMAGGDRRWSAGIHDDDRAGGFEPLIAGMRGVRDRRAACIIVGQDGGEQIGRRRTHAVEQGKMTVAVAEESQHRHHPIHGIEQRRRGQRVARREDLPQRQQVDQNLDQRTRIAADMAAIGQNLPVELFAEPFGSGADMTGLRLHA